MAHMTALGPASSDRALLATRRMDRPQCSGSAGCMGTSSDKSRPTSADQLLAVAEGRSLTHAGAVGGCMCQLRGRPEAEQAAGAGSAGGSRSGNGSRDGVGRGQKSSARTEQCWRPSRDPRPVMLRGMALAYSNHGQCAAQRRACQRRLSILKAVGGPGWRKTPHQGGRGVGLGKPLGGTSCLAAGWAYLAGLAQPTQRRSVDRPRRRLRAAHFLHAA